MYQREEGVFQLNARVQDAAAEDATAVDTTAVDGTAEAATAELLKKGGRYGGAIRIQLLTSLWTLRRRYGGDLAV